MTVSRPVALARALVTASSTRRLSRLVVAATLGLALVLVAAPTALAQPANDDFGNATVISSVPFSTTEDTTQATFDPSDPSGCSNNGSVWFAFTPPSNTVIQADTFGSDYDTVLSAWTGTQGALSLIACNDDFSGLQSQITFQATGGTTYYFMVAFCCGSGNNGGGSLQFSVNQFLPPGNDDFADATPIASLPFSDTVNLAGATTQPSEPSPSCVGLQNTAWYAFTPATTGSVSASFEQLGAGLGVYTGSSLADLTEVGCGQFHFQFVTFRAQANTTYYFQVGGWCCDGFGPVMFHLQVAPNPVAEFFFTPGDPSIFDTVQFQDTSTDDGHAGIASQAWDLGDGTTATGCCPTHRYAQDGDYTVELTVTTPDGRTASTSRVVHVETHDVAVVRIAVPKTAHVGQTITITSHLRNSRYPERVQVDLFKSVPGGFEQVGSLTQSVPVRPGNRTTQFTINYTFTQADGTVGKVSFKAVATIIDHRDAFPGDNELISPPVKIT
jgi:PKD repeat protein